MRRAIKFFVDNYVLTFSLFGALVLFGVVSAFGLGVDLNPEIEIPFVTISTPYPGASPEEVARQVSEPIEGQIATLPGLRSVTSTSSEGYNLIFAQFNTDVDLDSAAIDTSARVNIAAAELPQDAQTPTVQKFNPTDQPILSVALSSAGTDLAAVQQVAEDDVQPVLRRVEGIADVTLVGPSERRIEILLDPGKLNAFGLTPDAVTGALQSSALDMALGTLTQDDNRLLLAGRAVPQSIQEVENIRVDSARGISIADIATVRDSREAATGFARLNNEPVVLLEVRKASGANSVEAANAVRSALEKIELPKGYQTHVVNDFTTYISSSFHDTLKEILIAALAVSLIVLLFTGRLGSVFAVILAIPVSIAGALIVFNLMGFTFNMITLLAITVAIGLVVDDAIVVAENIDRYREEGLSRYDSVIKGAGSVSTAVLAATMSLLAVFLPISFLPGIIGQYFQQFGIAMAAAIAFSYLEAMFFLTVRLALSPDPYPPAWKDLRNATAKLRSDVQWSATLWRKWWFWLAVIGVGALIYQRSENYLAYLGLLAVPVVFFVLRYGLRLLLYILGAIALSFYRAGTWVLDRLRDAYVASLRGVLRFPWITLLVAGLLFLSLGYVMPKIGFNFAPPDDSGLISAAVSMPAGTTLEKTNEAVARLEHHLLEDRNVSSTQVSIGSGSTFGSTSSEEASILLQLVPKTERQLSTDETIAQLDKTFKRLLKPYAGSEVSVANGGGGGPPGSSSFTYTLSSSNLDVLRERAAEAITILQDTKGLRNPESDLAETTSERVFVVDPAKLDGTGLNNASIFNALSLYNIGQSAGNMRDGGVEVPILVRADPLQMADEQSLLSLPIAAPALESSLPLSSLGHFETRDAPATVLRSNQSYSATLSADLQPGENLSQIEQQVTQAFSKAGVLDEVVSKGEGQNFDVVGDLQFYGPIAFFLALLLNYLAIGSQFNSFKYPLYLLLTVPLALIGAAWLFFLTGTSLDIISVLGVIMLIGLVTKNAILLLDVVLDEADKGTALSEALLKAAYVRFRPIVMTTATVVVISFPLVLGIGEGSEYREPLGLVILGGVITSALLTLYVVPAAFYQFERKNYARKEQERAQTLPPTGSGNITVSPAH